MMAVSLCTVLARRPPRICQVIAVVVWSWFCTVKGHNAIVCCCRCARICTVARRKAHVFPALVRFARARPAGRAVEAWFVGLTVEAHVIG